ncbi:unnamed protein product [Anisakis simplex]|uniref:Protein VAC14 homolog (inferred by orthology to a human protein) n=1 Tax=Anisakis simplex TaxID=6269 RepID=A0A0M3JFZ1_ANISI|nr:unnamed protein product [Anisakis simplex]
MTESQYAPLTQAVVRTLTDKLYEKRKAAALDIEKFVFDFLLLFLIIIVYFRCYVLLLVLLL